MTLQIGMLGRDGIVVVGDTWQYVDPGDRPWYGYHSSKFRISADRRIAVAGAHDMDASFAVADEVIRQLSGPCDDRRAEILNVGNRIAEGKNSQCLLAFSDPCPTLYRFSHRVAGQSSCEEVIGCIPIGDQWSTAYYWAMRHYDHGRSCQQLARLGALVVISAGHISSGSIGGLEGFTCGTTGIRLWTRHESESLKAEIDNLEKGFRESVLGP